MSINFDLQTITPEIAKKWLDETNTNNRKLRHAHVSKMASDIVNGRWFTNGASIVFNCDGTLLDGQHRLAAIVEANMTIQMIVVRGVSKDAMPTIDGNISRSASDVLMLNNFVNSNKLSATCRLLICIKNNWRGGGSARQFSNGEVLEFIRNRPTLADSVSISSAMEKTVSVTIFSAWHYLAIRSGKKEKADMATDVMRTGVPCYVGDPIHIFRERIISMPSKEKSVMADKINIFYTLVAAWNDFLMHKPAKICKIRKSQVDMFGIDYSKI